ncbi:MAG TPA: GNAT family N-acetyltransferase [Acidimicrobiales bacterium]|nr:GNAT family N-acetyltransferase [Acidimicrobiales bacterium]
MQVGARVAAEGDVGTLADLYRAYRSALAGERGGPVHLLRESFAEPLETQLESIIQDGQWLVLLGVLDDVPVGLAAVRLKTMPDSSQAATVEVIYVDPGAREVGVGEQLLEAVAEWALRRGATGVDVRVLPGMRASKNFLEGSGFVARLLVMHRRLQE